jgi:hypothetical protein
MCKDGLFTVKSANDYQQIVYDYFLINDFYIEKFDCTVSCPCTSKSKLDPILWGNRWNETDGLIFNGNYTTFYKCYEELLRLYIVEGVPNSLINYMISHE